MKKLMIFALITVFTIGSLNSFASSENNEVYGNWKYEVPSAPHGYEKGTLIFEEKDGKIVGEVKFADGYKIELKNIVFENGELKCGLYIDYEYITIKAKIEGNKLTGAVNTPEGEMKLTAEKEK